MTEDIDPDPDIRVLIVDTLAGRRHWSHGEASRFYWEDGNGSCDCNRSIYLYGWRHKAHRWTVHCGDKRYIIVASSDGNLRSLNDQRPAWRIERAMKLYRGEIKPHDLRHKRTPKRFSSR